MDVWAAGHPDGDEQFNLSQGIVSKAPGPAATSWASIQQEIQHSAQIRGGSSGGPLVDREGRVVGINYAAPVGGTAGVNYAIAAAEAEGIVGELQGGTDITSIGLNGEALADGSGLWVFSVKPGFAARQDRCQGRRHDHQLRRRRRRRRRNGREVLLGAPQRSLPARRSTSKSVAAARRSPAR